MAISRMFLEWPLEWPVIRQFISGDKLGRGSAVTSKRTRAITARTATADRVVQSVCPYCAVGCGQRVFVKDEKVVQIEGDPDSPISRGRLCPKGSASEQLVNSPGRQLQVLYRAPRATDSQRLELDTAIDMIADRFVESRRHTWQDIDKKGQLLRRTMGIAALGGATLDNEENYLIKSSSRPRAPFRSRIKLAFDTPPRFPVWEPPSGVAAPPNHCRTWPTPIASSSRAPTWPSAIRWGSSGWRRPGPVARG